MTFNIEYTSRGWVNYRALTTQLAYTIMLNKFNKNKE